MEIRKKNKKKKTRLIIIKTIIWTESDDVSKSHVASVYCCGGQTNLQRFKRCLQV